LFDWEHSYIEWVPEGEKFDRTNDPVEILANGKGRCGEFSILYVSACLSLGYEARLVVSVRPIIHGGLHVWAEVMYDGSWVHVDPTDQIWNNPSRYKSWWGEIGKDALIFVFEDGKVEEITSNYS
jgi:transglutaminase-like putative cysteine protease